MLTLLSFVVAIALLVAVHEFGHFATAVALRVKVLRFSIGFGPRVAGWRSQRLGTEFVISALPFGGYVKFLDERDGDVLPSERALAFNRQTVRVRAAIVAGGPLANFLLAILLYSIVNWSGTEQALPILGVPVPGSLAERAGIRGGEKVVSVTTEGQESSPISAFDDLRWFLAQSALDHRDVSVELTVPEGSYAKTLVLPLSGLEAREVDASLFQKIGIRSPLSQARIGALTAGGAAQQAGLLPGDLVLKVNNVVVLDAAQLRDWVRATNGTGPSTQQVWRILRDSRELDLLVTPRIEDVNGQAIGRIGAYLGAPPLTSTVRYGFVEGIRRATLRTWEVSMLSLRMIGKIVVGEASLKNLSGPITIADYAGQSAALGVVPFAVFLALISVSLGVLNLLPLPVLDGGHLMYYLWESLTGRPVSESWMEQFQKLGLVVLLLMMSVAVLNDVTRLWG
ncbi:MAG: RIP metalloprotease RseP [Burkholderiales bacterium PBB4]|nr:MAG: RIP metalloprotease RseP [Burkholderiales bacterium PBB4]